MKLGIIGRLASGRRTLFGALTASPPPVSGVPTGVVKVPDPRLTRLAELYEPKKLTPATIEFTLPLSNDRTALRQADALVHIVNCFDGGDPNAYAEDLNTELLLSDIGSVEKRIERAKKNAKGDKKFAEEAAALERLMSHMNDGKPANTWSEFAANPVPELLTGMPVIYVCNVEEGNFAAAQKSPPIDGALVVCAKLECDLQELDEDERLPFLADLGIAETGLDALIRRSYDILGLISFLTAGKDEVRAWTIQANTKAPKAAGKIHSDLERGFIRAEVIAYADFAACADALTAATPNLANAAMNAAKQKGVLRTEGKDYIVRDGDIMNILFNV